MLLLRNILAATKLILDGLLVDGLTISSKVVLALATRSFSVKSVVTVLARVLSATINNCLSALRPLATMSACSELVLLCATLAYVDGVGWKTVFATFKVLSLMVSADKLTLSTRFCSVAVFVVSCLMISSILCLTMLVMSLVMLLEQVASTTNAVAQILFFTAGGIL